MVNPQAATEHRQSAGTLAMPGGYGIQPAAVCHENPSGRTTPPSDQGPRISQPILNWFVWYSRRHIRKHFHALRLSLRGLPGDTLGLPIVLYSNHASWWDPLVLLVVKEELFPGRSAYAPIDSIMLERYGIFRRLGFFAVEQGTRRGAMQFLRTAGRLLKSPSTILAVTPQGRFADSRERPPHFEGGLGLLATRVQHALFLPVVAEYCFWEERTPEILIKFGEPVEVKNLNRTGLESACWTRLFEQKMVQAQDELATEVLGRNPQNFRVILQGGAGSGAVYDLWRRIKAWTKGESFNKEHGTK